MEMVLPLFVGNFFSVLTFNSNRTQSNLLAMRIGYDQFVGSRIIGLAMVNLQPDQAIRIGGNLNTEVWK